VKEQSLLRGEDCDTVSRINVSNMKEKDKEYMEMRFSKP